MQPVPIRFRQIDNWWLAIEAIPADALIAILF